MSYLPETEQALSALASNQSRRSGEHLTGTVRVGSQGIYVGSENFDPIRHSPLDIDPMSPYAHLYGQDQVTRVIPELPLSATMAVDLTSRNEHPVVRATKMNLAYTLNDAIDAALPGMNDRLRTYAITDDATEADVPYDMEILRVTGREEVVDAALEVAHRGLLFVISDFKNIPAHDLQTGADTIAIKLNHRLERELVAGMGSVAIGRGEKVNTNNSRKLQAANARLEAEHQDIVNSLQTAGMRVASVIAVPQLLYGYDDVATDQAIAAAVEGARSA